MKTLVLTPHAEILPAGGSVVFSGGWCLTPNIKSEVTAREIDARVLPYRWDDREIYRKDFSYLTSVYEMYLEALSNWLNKQHGKDFASEYWRILAGPALYTLLCHLLDRWYIARTILYDDDFERIPCIKFPPFAFTPKLTIDLNPDCHNYNHYLIHSALISLGMNRSRIEEVELKDFSNNVNSLRSSSLGLKCKQFVQSLPRHVLSALRLTKVSRIVILNSYLPRVYDLALKALCFSLPVKVQFQIPANSLINASQRGVCQLDVNQDDSFCQFVSSILPELIPTYLLEDYKHLAPCWVSAGLPPSPRTIFTSNAFQFNEVFQHYMATQRVNYGTRLVVGQHGGVSGIMKWSFGTDHQVQIADKYISWGWESSDSRVVRGVVLTNFGKKIKNSQNGSMLLTTVPMRRYSHKGGAWPVGPTQSEAFLADQLNFCEYLHHEISEKLVLRIFEKQDRRFGSEYVTTWKKKFPKINVDDSLLPIQAALRRSRLFVYTYNSTGYLESLAMNFPTVLFWDVALFESNDKFAMALGELERVGIFHHTPKSAAEHINRIWDNVNQWWFSSDVQNAINIFIDQFARPPKVRDLFLIRKILVH